MTDKTLIHRFLQNIFWNLFGTVGARGLSFIATLCVARFLGKEGFGELGIIQSTVELLGTFAGFGLGLTTTKYIAELKDKDPERTGRIIALTNIISFVSGGIMMVVCLAAGGYLARHTLNAPQLVGILRISSILLPLLAIRGVQNGGLAGFQSFKNIAKISILQALLAVPLTIILVYWLGLQGAIFSLILSAMIGNILSSIALRKECVVSATIPNYRRSWIERGVLWGFALPAVLSGSLVAPVTWAANAILVNQPHGYAQMGLFNAANQIRMFILFIPNIIGMVTVPLLSEIHGQNNPDQFAQAVNANLRTLWGLTIPFGFLVIGFSSWLISLYGPAFQGGRTVLALMACVSIAYVASATMGQALIGSGKMWFGFLINLVWASIFLPLVIYLTPSKGAEGLAQAYFISYFFHTLVTLAFIRVKFGRRGIQYTPGLLLLTCIVFLIALNVDRFQGNFIVALMLLFVLLSAIWGWRILPVKGKQRIYSFLESRKSKLS
jgi:O-antigen/teichoic acid export membrane protein